MDLLYFILGWTELTVTFSPRVYAEVIQALKCNGIPFRTDSHFMGRGDRSGRFLGSLGERIKYQTEYQIFVKRNDLERARHVTEGAMYGS